MSAINNMWPSKSQQQTHDDLMKQIELEQVRQRQRAQAAQAMNSPPQGGYGMLQHGALSGSTPYIDPKPAKYVIEWEERKSGMHVAMSRAENYAYTKHPFAVIRELNGKYYVMREMTGEMVPYDSLELAKVFVESLHVLENG